MSSRVPTRSVLLRIGATALLVGGTVLAGWDASGAPAQPPVSAAPVVSPAPSPAPAVPSASPSAVPSTATATSAPSASPDAAAEAAVPAPRVTAAAVADGLKPARIVIPSIGVDSSLLDLGIHPDGTIEVPSDPARAGWLTTGPAPGQQGPAVIAGHVDSKTGPAVFYPLRQLAVGASVIVVRRDGSQVTFTVDGLQKFAKTDFPTQATYGPVPGPALRLITCDGAYVKGAGGYQDNLVVFAS